MDGKKAPTNWGRIRDDIAFYAEKYGYARSDYGHGLEAFAAHLFAQEEGFNTLLDGIDPRAANLGDCLPRSDDLGVDVVLDDDVNGQLLIAQAKWRKQLASLDEEDVASFFTLHYRLLDSAFVAHAGPQAHELLGAYPDKVQDGYSIQLRFVTNIEVPPAHRLRKLVAAQQEAYEREGLAIACELVSRAELLERDKAARAAGTGFVPEARFSIRDEKLFTLATPHRALVCRISGNELINLFKRHSISCSH